jgi:hypothetical protein
MMKYIVVKHELFGDEHIYLFQQDEKHADVAKRVCAKGDVPIRGGFVSMSRWGMKCFGQAISLNLYSDEGKDTEMLNREMGI